MGVVAAMGSGTKAAIRTVLTPGSLRQRVDHGVSGSEIIGKLTTLFVDLD